MSRFEIRELRPADWISYKTVRLNSLRDSPDAFGATYEREVAISDSEWQKRLSPKPGVNISYPLVAEIDGRPDGLASAVIWDADPDVAHIYQMWVLPDVRGMGIAKKFLERISSWAESRQCSSLKLSVTTVNDAAVRLYRRAGFKPAGALEPLRDGSSLSTQPMARELVDAV